MFQPASSYCVEGESKRKKAGSLWHFAELMSRFYIGRLKSDIIDMKAEMHEFSLKMQEWEAAI